MKDDLTTLYPHLRKLLTDFIEEYGEQHGNDWKSKALEKKYLYSESDSTGLPSNDELADRVGVTRESIRKELPKIAAHYLKTLESSSNEHYLLLKRSIKRLEKKDVLKKTYGFPKNDEKTLQFYLDGMGYTTARENGVAYCINETIYGKNIQTGPLFRDVIPTVKDIMEANPVPLKWDDVEYEFKKSFGDDMIRRTFAVDYLRADTDSYRFFEENGKQMVQMNWEALRSVLTRVVQILYDFACMNGFDTFMPKADLIAEYNLRSHQYGLKKKLTKSSSIARHEHIEPQGNGKFRYSGHPIPIDEDTKVDLKALLCQYLAEHEGIATFAELRTVVDSNGLDHKDISVKKSLEKDSVVAVKSGCGKKSYYILNEKWPYYESLGYKRAKVVGILKGTHKAEPQYKIDIKQRALELLKAAPGNFMTKKDLKNGVIDLYPTGLAINNLYKILQNHPGLMAIDNGYTLAPEASE